MILMSELKVGDICEARFFNPKEDAQSDWLEVEVLKIRGTCAACFIISDSYSGSNLGWSSNFRKRENKE